MADDNVILSDYTETIDMAVNLCKKKYCQCEIADILKGSDDVKKCIAIMNINTLTSQEFADLLLFHLTQHGGTVREAVAIKLGILFENDVNLTFLQSDYVVKQICDAIIDINPNISRIIIPLLNKLKNKDLILKNIKEKLEFSLKNILNSEVLQNHQINKYYFKIYWLLEALFELENIDIDNFETLITQIAQLPEYTVREKIAQLVQKYTDNKTFQTIKTSLLNDENYYVRRIFDKKSS